MARNGLERLAYELSAHALSQQEGAIDELRSRTGTLLAASAVVASFLGLSSARDGDLGVWGLFAIGAFVSSVVPSLGILWPNPQLIFSVRGTVLFEEEFAEPGGLSETHRRLAYWIEAYREANQRVLERRFLWFRIATLALAAEVIFLVLNLAGIVV